MNSVESRIRSLEGMEESVKSDMVSAFSIRLQNFSNTVRFYPRPFIPVSLTGTKCELDCRHCSGHYLQHMVDAESGDLNHIAGDLAVRGEQGILLSGGSRKDGSVPTYEHCGPIKSIKASFNLKISAHTGLVDRSQAKQLKSFGLDMALVDVIGSKNTIQEVYGLNGTPEDYDRTLSYLSNEGIALAPHIIVGLHGGELDGEFEALRIVRKYDPEVVVIVVFIPTPGTFYGTSSPPVLVDVVKVITAARHMFPTIPLSLSCVRPGGRYRSKLDEYALVSGVDRVAVPSKHCRSVAQDLGLKILNIERMCCSYAI